MRAKINNVVIEIYNPGQRVASPSDQITVLVGGCFDILHMGHMQVLEKAKAEGGYLIVALEPDETIVNTKNRAPVHNQQERAQNLAAVRYVDKVLLLPSLVGFEEYSRLTQDISPQVIAITEGDPHSDDKQKQADLVHARLAIVNSPISHLSSTKIHQLRLLNLDNNPEINSLNT